MATEPDTTGNDRTAGETDIGTGISADVHAPASLGAPIPESV